MRGCDSRAGGTPVAFVWAMLRITAINEESPTVTLQLEGRIGSDLLSTFMVECERWLALGKAIDLDFSGVTSIDLQGIELVRHLLSNRVKITRCSTLIHSLIDEEPTT